MEASINGFFFYFNFFLHLLKYKTNSLNPVICFDFLLYWSFKMILKVSVTRHSQTNYDVEIRDAPSLARILIYSLDNTLV